MTGLPAARDRGSATLWAIGALTVLVVFAAVFAEVGSATVSRHRAQGAADMAALAAAGYAPGGDAAACAVAERVARRWRSELVDCRLHGWNAEVIMRIDGSLGSAVGHALAGPVAAAGPGPDGSPPPSR